MNKIIEFIKGLFHKNYAYDISNPQEILKVELLAYNQDEQSFIVEYKDNTYYLPERCMIPKANIVFPLSEEDKKTIETITNKPFCQNGYCIAECFKGDRKEIVNCKIIGLAENKFLLVQYRYPFLDMNLGISYAGGYKIIKMEGFMIRKDYG